ncbi:redoxin domain-containing protein [Nitrosopumilus sp. K4]|uniref:redoxin family protein n=1 Tax=Nitrosopumilus sp. K4 TaxID=2795383 RepID=UPI001BA7E7A6|nr:redoxin family protein [Nitrosopumilus sp. K4]QUC65402.1 redoxin domain-containing protein [Nitrosopumilus sp. K4]
MKSEIKTSIMFGVGIVVAVIILSTVFSSLDTKPSATIIENLDGTIDKSGFKKAPDLVGIAHYLNTTPEKLKEQMKDKVILYDIWTYSCINCVRTLPYITAWNEKYSDEGLLIIGIHSPEFEFEKDPNNVKMAIDKHGISYPVVMDNEMETWKAFENRYWPRKYIADHEGYIRYDHIGEGAYQETEKIIQELLEERAQSLGMQIATDKALVNIEEFEHTIFRTPELYFGYKFAQGRNQLGSGEGFVKEQTVSYNEPEKIDLHKFYPIGDWKNLQDSMELVSETGSIKLQFNAKQVNIVTANYGELEIFLDGKPLPSQHAGKDMQTGNKITVSEPGLYNIIESNDSSTHVLEIKVRSPGFQIFTFTFG